MFFGIIPTVPTTRENTRLIAPRSLLFMIRGSTLIYTVIAAAVKRNIKPNK